MTTWRKVCCCLIAAVAALSVYAVKPAFQDYANGGMLYAFPYDANRTGVSVQVKGEGETEWTTVVGGSFTKLWGKTGKGEYATWSIKTNFAGTLSVRIADITSAGTGDYDLAEDVSCTLPITGTILCSANDGANAFDGVINNCDAGWVGYDFGRAKKVSSVRYIFRFDYNAGKAGNAPFGWSGRWNNSVIETATDAAFSDAQTVATITTDGYSISNMMKIAFSPAVETRYIRIRSTSGDCHSSVCELEFASDEDFDCPAMPITFDPMTFYNTNVVVRWPAPAAQLSSLSNRLERSRFAEGPWTGITSWYVPGDATVFTDETASVGIKYYYRVAGFVGNAQHYGAPYYSSTVSNRRLRCLERDLATPTELYENVSVIREANDSNAHYADKHDAFDGNPANENGVAGNYPDIWARPHLGLDFGTPCYFGSVWYAGRLGTCLPRVNGLCVWGSNDAEKPTADPVLLSEPFACDSVTGIGVARALANAELTSYRFLYAWKDADWFGNVAEMCFFGWTDADIEAAGLPACPQDLAGLNGDTLGTVRLTWGTGVNLTSYEVQCRPLGAAEWTAVQTGIDPSARSYDVTGLDANAWYEFRLIGHGADEDATSPTCRTYVYQLVPGSGTGLKTVLYGAQDALHITSEPTVEVSVRPDAEFDQQGGTLFAHANHAKAWVFLRGKLIVPLDGTYTLTLEAAGTDGYTCAIDGGVKVQYGNSAGVKNMIVPLTAGEHDLFIGYASVNERKFLHFTWALENVWGPRTVPTSQLIPASDDYVAPYLPGAFEGWTCSLPTVNTAVHPLVKFVEPGKYELRGSGNDFALGNSTLMTRLVRGPFVLDLDVVAAGGRGGIVVTDEAGSAANSLVLIFNGSMRGMKSGARGDIWNPAWPSTSATCQRLERLADKTLNFYMKTRTETEWTLVQTLPQGRLTVAAQGGDYEINLTGKRLRVGFHNFYNSGTSVVIQNIHLENPQPGMMLLVR